METTQGGSTPNSPSPSTTEAESAERGGRCCGGGHKGRRHGRKFLGVLALVLAAGALGGFIGKSFAHGHGLMGMAADPARLDAGVERMVKRFASRVDATPEQQAKLTTIAQGAAKDILPVREKLRDARRQAIDLARAPSVDRAALEKLRADQLQLADSVSRRMTQALADVAEVLTPEQRKKLGDRLAERMERHGEGGHGGWRS
jgi:protein CpxP